MERAEGAGLREGAGPAQQVHGEERGGADPSVGGSALAPSTGLVGVGRRTPCREVPGMAILFRASCFDPQPPRGDSGAAPEGRTARLPLYCVSTESSGPCGCPPTLPWGSD